MLLGAGRLRRVRNKFSNGFFISLVIALLANETRTKAERSEALVLMIYGGPRSAASSVPHNPIHLFKTQKQKREMDEERKRNEPDALCAHNVARHAEPRRRARG